MRPKHNRLITDALREISKTRSRFLSLLLLSSLAVAFLSGLRTTAPVMERTADGYYDHHNLMDLHVLSTLGLTDDDIDYLASLEDISAAEGCYTADGILHLESNDLVVKLVSLSEQGINTPELVEGRLPEADDECLVEPLLLEASGLSIGDKISFDTGDGDYADALAVEEFTIVGTANSPLYLSTDRGTSSLGTGSVNGFVLLPKGAFDMETYTDAYLTVSWAKDLYCYDDAYGDRMDALVDALEPLGDERAALRYDEVIGEANQALDDAQKEFDDAEAEANQELADARQELDDGWAEYYDGLETYETESADAWQQIADAEADLPEALKELEDGEKEYADGVQELADGKAKYWDGLKEWQDGKAEYDQGYQDLLDGEAEYSENYKTLSDAQKEYDEGWQEYQDGLVALEDGGGQLMAAEAELDAARRALEAGAAQISAGQAQLEAGRAALSKAKEDLNTQLGTLAQVLPVFSPGTALTSAEAILSPETPWTAADGQAIVTLLNLAGGSGALTGQIQDMVDQGLMTQEQADGLIAQLDAALAAAGGTDEAGAPISPDPEPLKAFFSQSIPGLFAAGEAQMADAEAQLSSASAQLSSGWSQYNEGKKAVDEARAEFEAGVKQSQEAEQTLFEARTELEDGWKQLADGRKELDDGWRELADAQQEISDGWAELEDARQEILDGEAELADGRAELDDGWKQYYDGVADLEEAKATLPGELSDAKQELDDAYQELLDGEAEYADGRAEAEQKLSDARQELNDARREVAEIEDCQWYILDRDTNVGYVSYQQDAERMGNLASVFPLIFFLVAALVCLTTMTRMVEDQRVEIGGLKALGYSRSAIALKYVGYGFLSSFLGGVLGLAVGVTVIPTIIFNAWKVLYTVGDMELFLLPDVALLSVGAAVLCVTGTAFATCFAALTAVPAQLMRPKSPKPGRRVLLERIRPLWKRMSFTWKVTIRNLFRYKKRFWMTVIGIGGCTALIITGFGIRNSLYDVFDKQYDEITPYSAQISLMDNITEDELTEIAAVLDGSELVSEWMSVSNQPVTAESDSRSLDSNVYLFTVADQERFSDFVHLRHRQDNAEVSLSQDGAVITEKLADMLDVGVGDTITLVDGDSRRAEVTITDLTENYVFHYLYITEECYESLFGQASEINSLMVTYTDDTEENSDAVAEQLIPLSGVSSVSRIENTKNTFIEGMKGVDYAVVIITVSAAALAFVVLFNLTNINITERMRELATLKVLGFYTGELNAYIYRENIFLTIFGILLGLVLGKFLHQWLIITVEIDMVMFGRDAGVMSYVYAAVLTALFSFLVNVISRKKLKKIDMVESLKTVD
ncbi:FtsX-like permease family protein [Pseudoflavonifractor capillosus]|uniref:Uncharacterized protein n=1 Tax=Pseudoflavonifractor capillosus TaxID=106588 RepID=A0A921MNK9_9FIRM|nr:FtsX-like permease family protein [Pseudoflavonifractor capillosus]HJG87615.1 hypothetical protein [Pseudoflavonifractor capillosus]